jgi:hypothetical protein
VVFSPQRHNIHYIHYIQYYAKGTASHIALYYLQYRISHKIWIKASLLIMNPKHSKAYVGLSNALPATSSGPCKMLVLMQRQSILTVPAAGTWMEIIERFIQMSPRKRPVFTPPLTDLRHFNASASAPIFGG